MLASGGWIQGREIGHMRHGTLQPNISFLAFNIKTPASVDGDVGIGIFGERGIEVVVCGPEPIVFHVQSRR